MRFMKETKKDVAMQVQVWLRVAKMRGWEYALCCLHVDVDVK